MPPRPPAFEPPSPRNASIASIARALAALALAWLMVGCAGLPPRPAAAPSHAPARADGPLADAAARALDGQGPERSCLRLLPEAETALQARLALAERARVSLDAQYYLVQRDATGRRFARALRDAAARGVRVRLLVDDFHTAGKDELLAGLAAHPNVEVRLFNPLPVRGDSTVVRVLASLHEFSRINQRMHNKMLVADNALAVTGGRNIGDEYFMRSGDENFVDLDVVSAGAVVRELSALFDRFWNDPAHVWPIEALVPRARAERDAWRERFDREVDAAPDAPDEPGRDVLGALPLRVQLDAGRFDCDSAPTTLVADTPDKLDAAVDGERRPSAVARVVELFARAERDVVIVSPYFVPGEQGMALIRRFGATQDNGRLVVVTNSFGSNDEPLAHAKYAAYRAALLAAGVRIHEIGASLGRRTRRLGEFRASRSGLHAKAAVVDTRIVYVGSTNFDARSNVSNLEFGLLAESVALARKMRGLFDDGVEAATYRLRLADDGETIEWHETAADGRVRIHRTEPDVDWRMRLKLLLFAPLLPEALF